MDRAEPGEVQHDLGLNAATEALAAGRSALIWRQRVADTETPISAALKLFEAERGDFLLESVEGGEHRGRYSLIGLAPDLVFRAAGEKAEINRHWQSDPQRFTPCERDSMTELRALVESCRIDVPEALPEALSCLVGYFSYETIGLVEKLPRASGAGLGLPDMLFVRPTVMIVFDRKRDEMSLIAPIWPQQGVSAEAALAQAGERLDACEARLAQPVAKAANAAIALPDSTEFQHHVAPEDYRDMVLKAKEHIVAGDIFQVVLAQRFSCDFPLPPIELYRSLRRINPSPFLFFLDLPGFAIVGSSPEILVRARNGEVTIRPIAGTRPRGASEEEDKANEISLLADPKECAEHLMLLDLGRNDVGRVASADSVRVTAEFTIERYSHVMHIVSNVVGRLAPEHDALDALFAGFPAGTVSGAPKIRACEIIAELEGEARGPYAGGVGYFGPDGNMDSCIVLRTGIVKDGVLHVNAGAGIVADSDPDYEQRECEAKAGALFAAAREALARAKTPGFGQ